MAHKQPSVRGTRAFHGGRNLGGLLALLFVLVAARDVQPPPLPVVGATEAGAVRGSMLGAPDLAQAAELSESAPVALDGRTLTIPQIVRVARQAATVTLAPGAMERVQSSFELVVAAAHQGMPIYGLNQGVGLNKDKVIFHGSVLDPEARQLSERFNANNLRATSAGAGPDMPEELVRAAMLVRLNTMLLGQTGAQAGVAERYRDFLNFRIHPLLPSRGSVGEADITILAQVGLAMMGEGEVIYAGTRMPARQALDDAGLAPLTLFGKDSLAIMSSNAYGAARTALAAYDSEHLLAVALKVFALSLEGLNGNVAPFLSPVHELRPYAAPGTAAAAIVAALDGSYLWERSEERALQDPLSFRTAAYLLGGAAAALANVREQLAIHLNTSDDNPAVIVGIAPPTGAPAQVGAYYVTDGAVHGAVIPTANFEPLPWVLPVEMLNVALSHVSRASVSRITRLGTAEFTHLTRFLAPDDVTLAYSAIQKVYAALNTDNRALSQPVSADFVTLAGDIEDTATNSVAVATHTQQIVENLYYIMGIELMHAAQAVDLRRRQHPDLPLGRDSGALFAAFRQEVPFLDHDRPLTPDIATSYQFVRAFDREGGDLRATNGRAVGFAVTAAGSLAP